MPVDVFDGRDAAHIDPAYLDWTANHPNGYVLNTRRNINRDYMALHRPCCESIADRARYEPGAYTEAEYAKVCADTLAELREWVRHKGRPDGSFTSEGCHCL